MSEAPGFPAQFALDTPDAGRAAWPALAAYVARQLDCQFPGPGSAADAAALQALLAPALDALRPILDGVRCFKSGRFDLYNSLQYTSFLYLLSRAAAQAGERVLADRLFCLNRALNAVDLYHAVRLPPLFFISHGLGAVLGNAEYGNRLVLFQHVTVGRVGDLRPSIGDDVVLYPGACVTGSTRIGSNTVVAAGTVLHNVEVPPDTVVKSVEGKLVFTPNRRRYIDLYFESAARA
jgi:serine O-acetyltransferase